MHRTPNTKLTLAFVGRGICTAVLLLSWSVSNHAQAFSLFSLGGFNASGKCVSVLETDPEINEHFTDGAPGQKVVLDEQFDDNRNNWPEERTMTPSDTESYTSTFRVRGGQLHLDNEYESSQPTLPSTLDADHDYLIETCFAVDGQYFGLIWGGRSEYDTVIGDDYLVFNIATDTKTWGYFVHRNGFFDQQKKAPSEHARSRQYVTLSAVKQGSQTTLFLNGAKVTEVPAYTLPGNKIGFDTPTNGRAVVDYLIVREAASAAPPKEDLYQLLKTGKHDGSLVSAGGFVYDQKTQTLWFQKSFGEFRDAYGGPNGSDYATVRSWIDRLNAAQWLGVADWRLPSIREYRSIYKATYSDGYGSFLPPFTTSAQYVWSNEEHDDTVKGWTLYKSGFEMDEKKTENGSALAATTRRFDLPSLLGPKDGARPEADLTTNRTWQKVIKAFHANLTGPGETLFTALLNKDAEDLYRSGIVDAIIAENLPLRLASQLLLSVKGTENMQLTFWYDYARVAVHANQPALTLQAAKKLESLADTRPEYKEEILDYVALFTADASMLLDKKDDAYAALLMRDNWDKKLFVIGFIDTDGAALLKEKARLVTMLSVDPDWVIGEYEDTAPQAMYNIETGQLVEPVETAPKLEAPSPASPDEKTTRSPKATVLD